MIWLFYLWKLYYPSRAAAKCQWIIFCGCTALSLPLYFPPVTFALCHPCGCQQDPNHTHISYYLKELYIYLLFEITEANCFHARKRKTDQYHIIT